jgi:hypothetical protein
MGAVTGAFAAWHYRTGLAESDVDAITLSMADAARSGDDLAQAAIAIGANTAAKYALVLAFGVGRVRTQVAVATAAVLVTGLLVTGLA